MKMFISVVVALMCTALVTITNGKLNTGINRPISQEQWTQETRVWAVRSLIGEVGWGNPSKLNETQDEWVSVMGVYAARVKETGVSLRTIIKQYSAAVKPRSTHRRPWLLYLNSECTQPKGWPSTLKWEMHKPMCEAAFVTIDRWANGEVRTLTPTANHFGGPMDHCVWEKVKTPSYFQNIFYNSNGINRKVPFVITKPFSYK